MADIRCFKLKTGEEFVALVKAVGERDDHQTFYDIENPVVPQPNGQGGAVFVPWCGLSASRKFALVENDLLFPPTDAEENVANGYKQAFQIGVITPPKSGILLG